MDTARYVEKITTLFGRLMTEVQVGTEVLDQGLTESQMQGLAYLFHHGGTSVGDLAQGLGITHPAAVKLIDRLVKKNLAIRLPSPLDRRVSQIELTTVGRELVQMVLSKRTALLTRVIGKLQPDELESLLRGLEAALGAALEDSDSAQLVCLRCGDEHIGCCVVNRTHLELTGSNIKKF